MADPFGAAVRRVIRAYHGSPYDFDSFDASKIGTGDGAQSYGYGHYLAQNEEVAKRYRDMREGELTLEEEGELTGVLKRMRELKLLAKEIGKADPRSAGMIDEWARLRSRREFLEERPGRMYEVEVGFPEDSLLDWDAPLSSQPEAVRRAFGSGSGSYHGMIDGPRDGERLWYSRSRSSDPLTAASELLDAGIPGIRYLDAGSRRAGDGSRNYVIFPGAEDSIRILRKYGLLAPVAAGAASQYDDE